MAGNKPQPVRPWLDDLGIDHKSNRYKFSCSLCADGRARDLKWDNITGHEDSKEHQKEEEKLAILAASRAQGLRQWGADKAQQQERNQLNFFSGASPPNSSQKVAN